MLNEILNTNENLGLNLLRIQDSIEETKFNQDELKQFGDFKTFLNDLISKNNMPDLITIICLKFFLLNYFTEWDTYIGKTLRKIPLTQIQNFFKLKNELKIPHDSLLNKKNKPQKNVPKKGEVFYKFGCMNGMMLKLLLGKFKIQEEFSIEKIMDDDTLFQIFLSFKVNIIKIVLSFGYRLSREIEGESEEKGFDTSLILNEETKKKIVKTLKTFPYSLRLKIAGRLVRNMVISLSTIGKCYKMTSKEIIQERSEEDNMSLIDLKSVILSEESLSLSNDDIFKGEFAMLKNTKFKLDPETNFFT